MNYYDLFMAPFEARVLAKMRQTLIAHAYGNVLELGAKTGANFQYYLPERVSRLTATDLSLDPEIIRNAPAFAACQQCSAEAIPYPDQTFDSVVETLVLCSVQDVTTVLNEVHRVLRPGGLFLHLDHELPSSAGLARMFTILNRIWPQITGGCNLTRRFARQIAAAGFLLEQQGSDGQQIFHWGVARKC